MNANEPNAPTPALEQLGRYLLLKKLGQGGMGTVYLAEDCQLGRRVAIKVPRLSTPDDIQRFHREARVAAAVDHPNVCPVLDIGEIDGIHYLIMPFLEGVLLSSLVEARHEPTRQPQAALDAGQPEAPRVRPGHRDL